MLKILFFLMRTHMKFREEITVKAQDLDRETRRKTKLEKDLKRLHVSQRMCMTLTAESNSFNSTLESVYDGVVIRNLPSLR